MTIKSDIPQICALRERIEKKLGKTLNTHSDFVELTSLIELELRQHISESTLERVWNYSTRGYDGVSLRTLNVLCNFAMDCNWNAFCEILMKENKIDSKLFNLETISTKDLKAGDKIRIGWLPNRLCTVRYLGDNRFIAEQCENSTMKEGDIFSCIQFILGKELVMSDFCQASSSTGNNTYIVGRDHGITTLNLIGGGKFISNNL